MCIKLGNCLKVIFPGDKTNLLFWLHSDMFPLFRELEGKISLGRGLLEKLATHKHKNVQGIAKLEKKVPSNKIHSVDHVFPR